MVEIGSLKWGKEKLTLDNSETKKSTVKETRT